MRTWAALALFSAGCKANPGPGTLKPGKIDESGYFTTTPYSRPRTTTPTPRPPRITLASIGCDSTGIRLYAETDALTGDGSAYLQDTTADPPQPSLNQTLTSFEAGPRGHWDHLEAVLPIGDTGDATFDCSDVRQHRLTWAVLVFTPTGLAADCVVLGDDPEGWLDGAEPPSEEAPGFDPTPCRPE